MGGRRTASHKARGTNSSALPQAQPSQAAKAGTAWGGTETTLEGKVLIPSKTEASLMEPWNMRSRTEEQSVLQAVPKRIYGHLQES